MPISIIDDFNVIKLIVVYLTSQDAISELCNICFATTIILSFKMKFSGEETTF